MGATTLTKADNARGWTETAWSPPGSGCPAWIVKPAWQHDANCGMRTVADVAAVADSNAGPAVYDTYGPGGQAGWIAVGGTSASSPLIAGIIGLTGGGQFADACSLYAHADRPFDVVGGSNGFRGGTTCAPAWPGTTPRPAWAPRTGSAPSSLGA